MPMRERRTAEGIERRREADRLRKRAMRENNTEKVRENKRRYYLRHKDAIKAKSKAYWEQHKERHREYSREYHRERYRQDPLYHRGFSVKKRYGITVDDYRQMLLASEGRCAICGEPTDRLCVDHDHASGKVRGLLCDRCNCGLGGFRDNEAYLAQAIDYLRNACK